MIRRILGWLRSGDPVVEQSAPAEPGCVHGVPESRECGVCAIAAIDRQLVEAVAARDEEAIDRLLAQRSAVRRRHVRSSVPVVPGRTT